MSSESGSMSSKKKKSVKLKETTIIIITTKKKNNLQIKSVPFKCFCLNPTNFMNFLSAIFGRVCTWKNKWIADGIRLMRVLISKTIAKFKWKVPLVICTNFGRKKWIISISKF